MKILITVLLTIVSSTFHAQSFNFSKIAEFEENDPIYYIDFDKDGIKDIVSYSGPFDAIKLSIYKGNNSDNFQEKFDLLVQIEIPTLPQYPENNIQIGDFDGDGDFDFIGIAIDLEAETFFSDNILFMLKNNELHFETIELGKIDNNTKYLFAGDYNYDGKTDLFNDFQSLNFDDSLSIMVFENDTIKSNTTIMSINNNDDFEVADINNNGKFELLIHDSENNSLEIIYLDSLEISKTLSIGEFHTNAGIEISKNLLDFDKNGTIDLAFRDNFEFDYDDEFKYKISVLYNIESDVNHYYSLIDSFTNSTSPTFFDIDGDGNKELIISDYLEGNTIDNEVYYMYESNGLNVIKSQIPFSPYIGSVATDTHLESDSTTGKQMYFIDASNEILISEIIVQNDNSLLYQTNTGQNSFSPIEFNEIKVTDINLDGYDDLLYHSNGKGIEIGLMYGNASGGFNNREVIVDQVTFPRVVKFEDFNNDGTIDILYTTIRSNETILLHNIDGKFIEVYNFDRANYFYSFSTSDFDNDGFMDIVLYRNTDIYDKFKLEGLRNNSGQGFELIELDGNSFSAFALIADLDNDGNKEFLEYSYSNEEISIYQIEEESVQIKTNPAYGGLSYFKHLNLDGVGNSEVISLERNIINKTYSIHIDKYNSDQKQLNIHCKSANIAYQNNSEIPEDFLFFDYNNDGFDDIIVFTTKNNFGITESNTTLFEYNGLTLTYKGELGDFIDYNTNIIPENHIYMDAKYGQNRYLVIDDRKIYILNDKERSDITLCAYLDANENKVKDEFENNVASTEIILSKNNTSYSFTTQNSGCTIANLPVDLYSVDLDPIDCLTYSLDDSLEIQIDTTYQFPLIINNEQDSILVDITRAHSRCSFSSKYWIQVYNYSCNEFSGTLDIFFDENSQNIEPLIGGVLINDHALSYTIEDLPIGGKLKFEAMITIPSSDFLDETLTDSFVLNDDIDEPVAMGNSPYTLRCAFDPNDKSLRPDRTEEYGDQYILNEELEYLIRFENVGNDSAINIKVVDTISEMLNAETLKIISASHNYRYTYSNLTRVLTVYFDNIFLPDNKVNEIEAHGYFKFTIKPIDGLDEFTPITNDAKIYFDFNSPILTNTVNSIFITDLTLLSYVQSEDVEKLTIFPNPTNGILHFRDGSKTKNNFSGSVYNSWGQKLMLFQDVNSISIQKLNVGIYFIKIDDGELLKVIKSN